jgi:hypothetical protein
MKHLLLTLSLASNLVLAGWWVRHRTAQPAAASKPEAMVLMPPKGTPGSARGEASQAESVASSEGRPASWNDFETDDLKELVRRLRVAGCPEETVQDIVLAEVNRRYAARTGQLWPDRFAVRPFWETSKQDLGEQKKNRERMRQERAMREEKSALLVDLLGVDPEKERRKAEGGEDWQDWSQRRVDFLPESKRGAAAKYLDEFEDKMQDFYSRNRGLYDAQYRAEQRQLEAERLQGLAQFLTPEELREYELRQSQLASQLTHDLRGLNLTREQYEAIYDLRKKYGDSIYNYGDIETKQARDQVQESQKALKAEITSTLGPDLGKEYERAQDYSYQQLVRLAKRNDLPVDTAARIYEVKEAAELSVKQIQGNQDLSLDKRQEALRQIRTETESTIKTALGEDNFKKYAREGGWWINNLAPIPRSPPKP